MKKIKNVASDGRIYKTETGRTADDQELAKMKHDIWTYGTYQKGISQLGRVKHNV